MRFYTDNIQASGLLGNYFGTPGHETAYDYVVVGGGTAGLCIANRLSKHHSVAVIEAGGFYELDDGNNLQIPANPSRFIIPQMPKFVNPLIDWNQLTTPQEGLNSRSLPYTTGKTLGGGSARNSQWYQKSCASSYDHWATHVGDDAYRFSNFDKYFQESASFTPLNTTAQSMSPSLEQGAGLNSNPEGGPVQVGFSAWENRISADFGASLAKLGLNQVNNFLDGQILGWSRIPVTQDQDQVRSSSESAFLREALKKAHDIQIFKNTVAKRILFANKIAKAVEVETGGPQYRYQLRARKEVIICAGAFRSPQLLMVSGIGPRKILEQHGIPVLSALPGVGQNLWDHITFGISVAVNETTHTQLTTSPNVARRAIEDYNARRSGILTNPGADTLAFERLPSDLLPEATRQDLDAVFPADWPEIEFAPFDSLFTAPPTPSDYITLLAILVAPFSRGTVSISSQDTNDNPIVDPRWFTDVRDHDVARAAYKRLHQILQTEPIASKTLPNTCTPSATANDEAVMEHIRNTAFAVSHCAGTCAMGKPGDENAVLDSKARVLGVQGIRVVDASAFPSLPPGHPQGTVYALAEKIAEDILQCN